MSHQGFMRYARPVSENTDDTEPPALREEQQAAALREVADLGAQRARLLEQADALLEPIREAAVKAARLGADRRRTYQLGRVGSTVFYRWLEAAGIERRAKRPAAAKTTTSKRRKSSG
jgi:hypothetical protein